jgi:hypothetical protein
MWLKTIESVAEQLCIILKDYDVAYMVAEMYVPMRVDASIKKCRKFHIKLIRNRFGPNLQLLRCGAHHCNSHPLFHSTIVREAGKMNIRRNDIWLSSICNILGLTLRRGACGPTIHRNDLKTETNRIKKEYLFRLDSLALRDRDDERVERIQRENTVRLELYAQLLAQQMMALQ